MDHASYSLAIEPTDPSFPKMLQTTEIPGLLVYQRETFADNRGFFREVVELKDLETVLGKKITITQWNHSNSRPSVVRGFHAEPWEKIVYVVKGQALAVIVDLRTDSPTFGKTVKIELNGNERKTLYLPKGMGNSFANIGTEDLEYMYIVTDYYKDVPTPTVNWNDLMLTKQFGGWPIAHPIVSDKDMDSPTLKEKFKDLVDFTQFPWLQE